MLGRNSVSPAADNDGRGEPKQLGQTNPKINTQSKDLVELKSQTETSWLTQGTQSHNTYGHGDGTKSQTETSWLTQGTQSHNTYGHSDGTKSQTETSWLTQGTQSHNTYGHSDGTNTGCKMVASGNAPLSTLRICHVNYIVKERIGSWWQGACFREVRKKVVLNDISMCLRSGEITAILGNSGSGKTSLLDVITCRTSGTLTGQVFYNNAVCTRDVIKNHTAYVMQADRLLPNLTVRETLRYSARLKLPGDSTASEIEDKVRSVIMEMGLKDVADSRIGNSVIRGISGGEQRRVTIAIHLLKDPDLVLLDEPTSGLDSYTARYLVSNLHNLARRGKIVLLTIHQPSSDIFQFFDQIALMSVGEMVYCDPAKSLVPYFTNLGYPCERYTNPLDRYVDVASVDRRDKERETASLERVKRLVQVFKSSNNHQTTEKFQISNLLRLNPSHYHRKEGIKRPSYPRILSTLVWRMNRNVFRDRRDYLARLVLMPMFMIFILLLLGKLKHTQSSINDRMGVLYNSCTVPTFIGVINCAALYPCLRDVYYRETIDGLYGSATLLLAYTIHIVPFHIFSSILFSSILYWSAGLQPYVYKFGYYTLAVVLLHYHGEMLAVACLGLFINPNMTTSIMTALLSAVFAISSGFIKTTHTLVKPLQWLSWAFIYRYSGEVFVANEFSGLELECPVNLTSSCFEVGDQFIDRFYPGATDHMARNFAALGAFAVGSLVFTILLYKLVGPKTLH